MDYDLPEHIREIQETTRRLVDEMMPFEQKLVETGLVPTDVEDRLRELGYFGLTIPEEYGGIGLGILASVAVQLELSRLPALFCCAFRTAVGAGTRILVNHGSREQREKWLPRIAAGACVTAFALTEANAGSDAAAIQSVARCNGDRYLLNGTKMFVSNGAFADLITVLAYTDKSKGAKGGVSAFLVEKGSPGLRVGGTIKTMAFGPEVLAELVFEDCEVPVANRLGEEGQGFRYAMECLDEARLNISANALGQGEQALRLAVEYAKQRVAFGKPIAEFQAIQHMIAEMATEMHVARTALLDAARRYERGERIRHLSSMVKLFCTETAWRTVDKALQIHGGAGYCREMAVERLYRDVRLFRIVEGTSEIHKNIIARQLLK